MTSPAGAAKRRRERTAAGIVRAMRPNLTEIILLEKNPLRARGANVVTIGKRSAHLHDPSGADLIIRWFGSAALTLMLVGLTFVTLSVGIGLLVSNYWLEWYAAQFLYPAALWFVAAFLGIVRFLSYLDLRIRHEGWEVELLMRAETLRLAGKGAGG